MVVVVPPLGATVVVGPALIVLLSPMMVFVVFSLPALEMWMFVIGAPMFTFWNCMPISPKPPSLNWLSLAAAGSAATAAQLLVPGSGAAATAVGTAAGVEATPAPARANMAKKARPLSRTMLNRLGRIQRFSMYI